MKPQPIIPDNVVELHSQNTSKASRKKRVVFRPKLITVLLCFVLVYVLFSFMRVEMQIRQTDRQLAVLKQKMQQLELEKAELEKRYELLHDDAYIEGLARQYLMIRPGEKLVLPSQPGEILPLDPEAAAEQKRD